MLYSLLVVMHLPPKSPLLKMRVAHLASLRSSALLLVSSLTSERRMGFTLVMMTFSNVITPRSLLVTSLQTRAEPLTLARSSALLVVFLVAS